MALQWNRKGKNRILKVATLACQTAGVLARTASRGSLFRRAAAVYIARMTIEQLRLMHQKRPFEPFEIYLADGRSMPVEHPEFLAQSPSGRTISVGLANGTHEIIDLLLVTSLKVMPGGTRRRRSK